MKRWNYDSIVKYLKKYRFQKRINALAKKYKGKNIIIYGTGITFKVVKKNFDISHLNVIALSDLKFKKEGEYEGYKTISPNYIANNKPDVVLICMMDANVAEDYFESILFPDYGRFNYDYLIEVSLFYLIRQLVKSMLYFYKK